MGSEEFWPEEGPDEGPSHVPGEEPEEAPCPLDWQQTEAYREWLAHGELPAWAWEQVVRMASNPN